MTHLAANRGEAEAAYELALIHAQGQGVETDSRVAFFWMQKAASKNLPKAQRELAFRYANGLGVDQSDTLAIDWYRKAAAQNDFQAIHALARLHDAGRGVKRDFKAAAELFRKAAEQGYAPSQKELADKYGNGRGVPRSMAESNRWMQKAADQEYAPAMTALMHDQALGTPQNSKAAIIHYKRARPHVMANVCLGLHYYLGDGVAVDESEAMRCYGLSEKVNGNAEAAFGRALIYSGKLSKYHDDAAAFQSFRNAATGNLLPSDGVFRSLPLFVEKLESGSDKCTDAYAGLLVCRTLQGQGAQKLLDSLGQKMSPESKSRAEKRAEEIREAGVVSRASEGDAHIPELTGK